MTVPLHLAGFSQSLPVSTWIRGWTGPLLVGPTGGIPDLLHEDHEDLDVDNIDLVVVLVDLVPLGSALPCQLALEGLPVSWFYSIRLSLAVKHI